MLPLTSPTVIPSLRAALGSPIRRRSPIQQVPHQPGRHAPRVPAPGGLAHAVSPPRAPAFASPTRFLSASGPSPARRVPQLHRLHGAAGSRPGPLSAPSSRRTSQRPPRRPSHTSAFRPHRKRCAARGAGRGREDGRRHVVRRGVAPEQQGLLF